MTVDVARASADWLTLREPADARARSRALVEQLRGLLPPTRPLRIHDLGSGTGSLRRWLAPQLPGQQQWVEHDRDVDLLRREGELIDGSHVTVETRASEVATLGDLDGADLVTASALLDVLTSEALDSLIALVAQAHVPCLLTLSVVGRVELHPPSPLDRRIQDAFNDHQRRTTPIGELLGPDAVFEAIRRFRDVGMDVRTERSPWILDAREDVLLRTWFEEWVAAACEQDPSLSERIDDYVALRRAQLSDGVLTATVHHLDLLAWWP